MDNFSILYFDGKTSMGNQAMVYLEPHQWRIVVTDEYETNKESIWYVHKIEKRKSHSSITIFEYGDFPKEYIETVNENFLIRIKELYPDRFKNYWMNNVLNSSKNIIIIFVLMVVALLATYFYAVPYLAERVAEHTPLNIEQQLGEAAYNNIMPVYKVDDSLTKNLNLFAQKIDFKTPYDLHITVVNEPVLNAFALPGGEIVVFDGLLKKMKTKEELAALLSHEAAHIHHRHSLKGLYRSISGYLLLSILTSDVNGILAVVAENSNLLQQLKYTRELETEADEKGMLTMINNGLSIEGYVSLFKILKEEEHENTELASMFSTHPLTNERINKALEMKKGQTNLTLNDDLEIIWQSIKKP